MVFLSKGYKEKYSGFNLSIDYISKDRLHSCVLLGIYKRPFWNVNKKCLNIGYIFIGYKNIINLLMKG